MNPATIFPIAATTDVSLWSLIMDASLFVQLIMVLLVILSIWSWAIAINKFIILRILKNRADKFEETFWSGRTLEDLSSGLSGDVRDPMARIFAAAMKEWEESKASIKKSEVTMMMALQRIDSVMNLVINREVSRVESGMAFLATTGAVSLFIGLLGTVQSSASLLRFYPFQIPAMRISPWWHLVSLKL